MSRNCGSFFNGIRFNYWRFLYGDDFIFIHNCLYFKIMRNIIVESGILKDIWSVFDFFLISQYSSMEL